MFGILNLSLDVESNFFYDSGNLIIIWIALTIALLVVESLTTNLTTIWFAIGAIITAIVASFGVDPFIQIIVFVTSSAILLILTRPLIKKFNKKKTMTNKDNLLGLRTYVTEKIDNIAQTGYIKIGDVFWAARSADDTVIDVGALVEIKDIHGNKLIVSAIKLN